MEEKTRALLQKLPSMDKILKGVNEQQASSECFKKNARKILADLRQNILTGVLNEVPAFNEIVAEIALSNEKEQQLSLQKVINATGTIIHTNLGRSVLSEKIKEDLEDIAFSYSNLEFDLEEGQRGSRYQHLEKIIRELTGAEDVLIVNNNAAAVMLVLNTLIKDKEVLISRGELVEIGGSFRIPEVIKLSGGKICEVGTTNKTHLKDYREAITDQLGAFMKVHTSNYRVVGFTEAVELEELAKLAQQYQVPLINDLGSGLLIDLQEFGLPYEPTVKEALEKGCDVVMFSGDKLLGGPQAGIIVGKSQYIQPMKSNQLLRALRIDKLTLAALEATLSIYRDKRQAISYIPTLQMISKTLEICLEEAQQLKKLVEKNHLPYELIIQKEKSKVGGGSFPEYTLPTYALCLRSEEFSINEMEKRLRSVKPAVITRTKKDWLLLDLRTLTKKEFSLLVQQLKKITEL